MTIEQQPFVRYKEEGEERADIFTIRLNAEERAWLDKAKIRIQQPKDSSALKLLAEIGSEVVLHDPKIELFIRAFYRNLKNNARLGIPMPEADPGTNVTPKKGD